MRFLCGCLDEDPGETQAVFVARERGPRVELDRVVAVARPEELAGGERDVEDAIVGRLLEAGGVVSVDDRGTREAVLHQRRDGFVVRQDRGFEGLVEFPNAHDLGGYRPVLAA